MTRRAIGATLMGLGGVMAAVGLIGLAGGDGDSSTTTTAPLASATTTAETTSTTQEAETTTTIAVTTSVGETTTSEPVFDELSAVEEFILQFISAIESGDSEFLYERLHPAVKEEFEEQLCRDFIDREILALENYMATGPATGPSDGEFQGVSVTSFDAPVSFTFQGEDFEARASYAITEGTVRWFAVCR